MKHLISFGYSFNLVTDNSRNLTQLIELLQCFREADGTGKGATIKEISYEIKTVDNDFGNPSTAEAHYKKEAEDNNNRWYKEYTKNQELEKQLKNLQAASLKSHYTTDDAYREDGGERVFGEQQNPLGNKDFF